MKSRWSEKTPRWRSVVRVLPQMKWWLRPVARNQPFTFMVDAMRGLTQGGPVGHAVLMATVWMVGMTVVFAALAVHRYRQG